MTSEMNWNSLTFGGFYKNWRSAVDFPKLSQYNAALAGRVMHLADEGRRLGAVLGVQRLELVGEHFNRLTPDVAYRWIDPSELKREVEEAQTLKRENLNIVIIRNILLVAPLIFSGYVIYYALNLYQLDLLTYPSDVFQPLLHLWQNGFHGRTSLTFSLTLLVNITLFLLYVFFNFMTLLQERRTQNIVSKFAQHLQKVTEELMAAIAAEGSVTGTSDADIDRLSRAISMGLFSLEKSLVSYQDRMTDLTQASSQIAKVSNLLAENSDISLLVGQEIRKYIIERNNTEQTMVAKIEIVQQQMIGEIKSIANHMLSATKVVEGVTKDLSHLTETIIQDMKYQRTIMIEQETKISEVLPHFALQLQETNRQLQNTVQALNVIAAGSDQSVTKDNC